MATNTNKVKENFSCSQVLEKLQPLGSQQTKTILARHGAREPFFGVKVGDIVKVKREIGKDHNLAIALYDTGITDAMFLATLIADRHQVSEELLQKWVENAYWNMLSEYAVPSFAAESKFGWEMGIKWIHNKSEEIAAAGWSTLSFRISLMPDEKLDIQEIQQYLQHIKKSIHNERNRVRYAMNNFLIFAGCYITQITEQVVTIANEIGNVEVDMGQTSCKVPNIIENIDKTIDRGRWGIKRKRARIC